MSLSPRNPFVSGSYSLFWLSHIFAFYFSSLCAKIIGPNHVTAYFKMQSILSPKYSCICPSFSSETSCPKPLFCPKDQKITLLKDTMQASQETFIKHGVYLLDTLKACCFLKRQWCCTVKTVYSHPLDCLCFNEPVFGSGIRSDCGLTWLFSIVFSCSVN